MRYVDLLASFIGLDDHWSFLNYGYLHLNADILIIYCLSPFECLNFETKMFGFFKFNNSFWPKYYTTKKENKEDLMVNLFTYQST